MHDFRYVGGELFCEGVSVASLVKKIRHAPLHLFAEDVDRPFPEAGPGARPARSPRLLRDEIQFEPRRPARARGFRRRLRYRQRRRTAPRHCGGRRSEEVRFRGRRQNRKEIEFALRKGIYSFNVESEPELIRINEVAARLKKKAPVAVRINPNIDAHTHAKITTGTYANKFGIAIRGSGRRLRAREQVEESAFARIANAHRLAVDAGRAVRSKPCAKCCRSCKTLARASTSNSSASAAAWASFTRTPSPAVPRRGGRKKAKTF
jgi:hypothetical protein